MSFRFRLESLLKLRQRERDHAGALVGEANAAIAKLDQQIDDIQQQRIALANEDASVRTGEISVDHLLNKGRYDLQLQADIHGLHETRLKINEECDRRRKSLMDAEIEVKKLEQLQQRQLASYQAADLRREQAQLDEMNNRRVCRERK